MNNKSSDEADNKIFKIYKIYLKDVSFETPNTPDIFTVKWDPKIELQVSNDSTMVRKSTYEVVLSVLVTVKVGKKTAYLVEINHAGIFGLRGYTDEQLDYMLNSYCPNILYPFAREAAVGMVQKGGFEQLILLPVDFDTLHLKQLEGARMADEKSQEIESQPNN